MQTFSALLELYRSYDGEAAGAVRLTLEEDGRWVLRDYYGKSSRDPYLRGTLLAADLEALREFLAAWRARTAPLANGWAEPEFGGYTDPIDMAAVRASDHELHFRSERFAEGARADPRREEVLSLVRAVAARIPALTRDPWLGHLFSL